MIFLFNMFNRPQEDHDTISYSDFLSSVEKGNISTALIQGSDLSGKYVDGRKYNTFTPRDPELISTLRKNGVRINVKPEEDSPWYMTILISWFPMILLIGVWIFFMRQMQVGGGKAMAFGKSKARLLNEESQKVTFEDVAGVEEAKEELNEIVEFLRDPKKFTRLGGRIPKGVLLMGAPGTGKTLSGAGHRRRSRGSLFLHQRLRLCGDVRGRGRFARTRSVCAGQEKRAVHHLYR